MNEEVVINSLNSNEHEYLVSKALKNIIYTGKDYRITGEITAKTLRNFNEVVKTKINQKK